MQGQRWKRGTLIRIPAYYPHDEKQAVKSHADVRPARRNPSCLCENRNHR